MVRFYKSYLGRLLLGLLILIELERQGGKDGVVAVLHQWTGGNPNERHIVENAIDLYISAYPDESPTNDDVLKGAFGQMLKNKSQDGDLLDLIITAIGLPIVNYFNTGTLRTLRDAILTPFELTELRKAFKSNNKCTCGHEFQSGEMTTINMGENSIMIQCNRCTRPMYVRCDYCEDLVPLNAKVGASLRNNVDCGCRKRAMEAKTPELAVDPMAVPPAVYQRAVRAPQGFRDIRTTPRAAPPATAAPPMTTGQHLAALGLLADEGNPIDDEAPV